MSLSSAYTTLYLSLSIAMHEFVLSSRTGSTHVCVCVPIGAITLHLKDNYRSTPQVLRGAEGVLTNILSTGVVPERAVLNPLLTAGPNIQVPLSSETTSSNPCNMCRADNECQCHCATHRGHTDGVTPTLRMPYRLHTDNAACVSSQGSA